MMQRGIAYQQFFRSRHHSAYFEVAATPIPLQDTVGDFKDKMRKDCDEGKEATSNKATGTRSTSGMAQADRMGAVS